MIISEQLRNFNLSIENQQSEKTDQNKKLRKLLAVTTNTFIYLQYSTLLQTILVQCDQDGKELLKYKIPYKSRFISSNKVVMPTEDQIIVAECQDNRLAHINLKTHQVNHFQHKFAGSCLYAGHITLHAFSETSLLCVQEQIDDKQNKSHRLKLTYYSLPLVLQGKPSAYYESTADEFVKGMKVTKANSHSTIVWFDQSSKNEFTLHVFNLQDFTKGKYSRIEVKNINDKHHQHHFLEKYPPIYVWQKKRGQFLLAYGSKQNIYVMRLEADKCCIFQTKIQFGLSPSIVLQFCYNLGQFCVIDVCNHPQKGERKYYTIYICNETQNITLTKSQSHDYNKIEYFLPSYNPNLINKIIHSQFGRYLRNTVAVNVIEVFSWQQVTLHFLLHQNEDFDDDLLKDAVEMIDYQYRQQIQEQQQMIKQNEIEASSID